MGHPERSPSCLGLNSDDFPFFKTLNRTTVAKVSFFHSKFVVIIIGWSSPATGVSNLNCSGGEEQMKERSVRNSGILYIKLMIPLQIPPGPRIFRNFSEAFRNFSETLHPTKKGLPDPPKKWKWGHKKSLSSNPLWHVHFAKNQVQFGIFWPLEPHFIGGPHPVLYFPSQIQRNIVQRCAKWSPILKFHTGLGSCLFQKCGPYSIDGEAPEVVWRHRTSSFESAEMT